MKRILPVALLLLALTPVFSNAQSTSACTTRSSINDSSCISLIQELLAQIAVLQKLIQQIIANQALTATKPNDINPSIPVTTPIIQGYPSVDIKVSQTTWDGPISIQYNNAEFIAWTSTNASYCNGSKTGPGTWGGTLSPSGTLTTGSITSNTTFTVTCQDTSGRVASDSIVFNVQNVVSSAPTVDLKVGDSDGPITVPSNTSKNLTWNSTNASRCSGYSSGPGVWGGVMALTGIVSTGNITTGTTFYINCQNAAGQNASDSVTVNVSAVTTGSAPVVSLYANSSSVSPGAPVTLNWSSSDTSTNTAYCYSQQFQTNNALHGQVIVYPQTTTLYEVTCNNQYGSSKASATVSVNTVTTSGVPYISVISPKGGESFTAGVGSIPISYTTSNILGKQLTTYLVHSSLGNIRGSVIGVASEGSGSYNIELAKGGADPVGQYKITICANDVSDPSLPYKPLCASSPAFFSLVQPIVSLPVTDAYTLGYNQTSSISLSSSEKTAIYEYTSSPCGTLMTQYVSPGSVSASSGAVYNAAASQCSTFGSTPNTTTFRVYSCQNFSDPSTGYVRARATFAFQCLPSTNFVPPTTTNGGGVQVSMSGDSNVANVLSGIQSLLNSISESLNHY